MYWGVYIVSCGGVSKSRQRGRNPKAPSEVLFFQTWTNFEVLVDT